MKKILMIVFFTGLVLFPQVKADTAEISNLRTSTTILQPEIEKTLFEDWIVIRSIEQDQIDLFNKQLQIAPKTIAIAGINSEIIFIAVIQGSISVGDEAEADPGNVLLLGYSQISGCQVSPFNANDFSERLKRLGSDELVEYLQPVIDKQKIKIFWGLLRPSKMNVNKPYNAVFEEGRRKYTLHPILIRIKAKSGTDDEFVKNSANAFISALQGNDIESTAALLSPLMFLQDGRTLYSNDDWIERRRLFAQELCDKVKAKDISSINNTADRGVFQFSINEQEYFFELHVFDGSYFVTAVTEKKS